MKNTDQKCETPTNIELSFNCNRDSVTECGNTKKCAQKSGARFHNERKENRKKKTKTEINVQIILNRKRLTKITRQ